MKINPIKNKEKLATWSGLGMLIFGVLLTAAGFIVPPLGEVHSSVLWVLGQALIYSGSIWGIAAYGNHKINQIEKHYYDNSNSWDSTRN